jgi:hypothetical protein
VWVGGWVCGCVDHVWMRAGGGGTMVHKAAVATPERITSLAQHAARACEITNLDVRQPVNHTQISVLVLRRHARLGLGAWWVGLQSNRMTHAAVQVQRHAHTVAARTSGFRVLQHTCSIAGHVELNDNRLLQCVPRPGNA